MAPPKNFYPDNGVEKELQGEVTAMDVGEEEKSEIQEKARITTPQDLEANTAKTPTKTINDFRELACGDVFTAVKAKASTSSIFNVDDYVPVECRSTTPRSPTPPPKKKPCFPGPKKAVGKSTIKKPSTSTPTKGPTAKKNQKECSEEVAKEVEQERLKVLRNLGESLANEGKDEGDEDYHWTKTLYRKAKNVTDRVLKEQSASVCHSIMSHAVIGVKHPAVEAMFPTFPARNVGYSVSLPNPNHVQQYPQVYYAPPPYVNQNQSTGLNVIPQQQGQQLQTVPQPTLNPTPTPSISHMPNQPPMHNVQPVGQQNPSPASGAASSGQNPYVPNVANDYTYGLSQSPLKTQPNIFCHTLNTYATGQQQGANPMEFSQI